MTGVAITRVTLAKLNDAIVPLAPLAEQRRIVAKVDELMRLCDELEARQTEQRAVRVRMSAAALDRLTKAADQSQFAPAWQRLNTHFDTLFARPESLAQLRQTLLQLAVMGKLVEQDPNDEPAAALSKAIAEERERLIAKGEIKKSKPMPPIEFGPFELPPHWKWVRFGHLAKVVEYGTGQKASEIPHGVPTLRMNNIRDGRIILEKLKYVPKKIKDLPRLFLKPDDILFNRTNSLELVGKTGIYKGEADTHTFASYLIRTTLFSSVIPDYVNMAMNAEYFRKTQIEPEVTQQCGQANFNGTKLTFTLIPIPPTNEQKRIVQRVQELIALCDTLEAQLARREASAEELLEAMVAAILDVVGRSGADKQNGRVRAV